MSITLRDIYDARRAIAPWVKRTPLVFSAALSERAGASVYLKLETTHDIGSFKIRGATNRLMQMTEDERWHGIVAVSTGNHGRAVAWAAKRLGIRAVVYMSSQVLPGKAEAIRNLGADVRVEGDTQDEAEAAARRNAETERATLVHPFDDPHVIAGQGTIGLEILEDLPEIDTLVTAMSGGGLVSGIGTALKAASPDIRVIGVSMERGPAMIASLKAGRPVPVQELPSLADSLIGGIAGDNQHTFELVRRVVDRTATVSEQEIVEAMKCLYFGDRVVAEGGGAVPVAALLHGKVGGLRGNVVCVVSGENIDMNVFQSIINGTYSDF